MIPEHALAEAYLTGHGREAARDLELMEPTDAAALLAPLPAESVAEGLRHIVPYLGARILTALPSALGAQTLTLLPTGQARALLRRMPAAQERELLDALAPESAARIARALASLDGTAGALADADVLTLASASTVGQALARLRRDPARASYYVYVLESEARLVGVTSTTALVAAPADSLLANLCEVRVVALPAEAGLDEMLQSPHWRDFHVLPVVERDGTFVGALRLRTLREIAGNEQVATEPLSSALLKLWELYAVGGINLMTGFATGLDVMAARTPAPGADPAESEEER